jgi:hypothetical protein
MAYAFNPFTGNFDIVSDPDTDTWQAVTDRGASTTNALTMPRGTIIEPETSFAWSSTWDDTTSIGGSGTSVFNGLTFDLTSTSYETTTSKFFNYTVNTAEKFSMDGTGDMRIGGNVTMFWTGSPTVFLLDAPAANTLASDGNTQSNIVEFESKAGLQSSIMR